MIQVCAHSACLTLWIHKSYLLYCMPNKCAGMTWWLPTPSSLRDIVWCVCGLSAGPTQHVQLCTGYVMGYMLAQSAVVLWRACCWRCGTIFGCCSRCCTNLHGNSEASLQLLRCGGCGILRWAVSGLTVCQNEMSTHANTSSCFSHIFSARCNGTPVVFNMSAGPIEHALSQ